MSQTIISQEAIKMRVRELGKQISCDYTGESLVAICVLKGAIMFTADLVREITVPLELDFIGIKSYEHGTNTGSIQVTCSPTLNLEGKNLLIIEDIIDSGHTIDFIKDLVGCLNPKSIKICSLLSKSTVHNRNDIDYIGFEIGPEFIYGYGLDDKDGLGRNVKKIVKV